MTDNVVYTDEISDLLRDVQAWVELQELGGAHVFPTEPLLAPADRLPPRPPAASPAQASPRATPARPAAPARERPARPQFAAPAPAATPQPQRAAPPPRPSLGPKPAAAPAKQPSLGRWAAWLQPATGAAAPSGDPLLQQAATLQQVRDHLGDCTRCGLCESRRNIVFGVGTPTARLVVIGEAPGAQEDRRGEPFVGPAGQMLDKMLERVLGLSRSEVYIANVIKCRPPGNRNPSPDEIARCKPFLDAQLRTIQPDLALVLGSVAFRTVFGTSQGIKRNRGQWRDLAVGDRTIRAMPTFHPAYLLRQPAEKRLTFQDLQALKGALDALPAR